MKFTGTLLHPTPFSTPYAKIISIGCMLVNFYFFAYDCFNKIMEGEAMNHSKPFFAILTPFKSSGDIDYQAFKDYLTFLRNYGVENIITNGTTGEFSSLTQRVWEYLKKVLKEFKNY